MALKHYKMLDCTFPEVQAKVSDICKLQIQKDFVANNEKLFVAQKDFAEKYSYLFEYKPNF